MKYNINNRLTRVTLFLILLISPFISVIAQEAKTDSILKVYTEKHQTTLYFDTLMKKKNVLISSSEDHIFGVESQSKNKAWAVISEQDSGGGFSTHLYYLPQRKLITLDGYFLEIADSPQGEYVETDNKKLYLNEIKKQLNQYKILPEYSDQDALYTSVDPVKEKQLLKDALAHCKLTEDHYYVSVFFGSKMGKTPWQDLEGDKVFTKTDFPLLSCNKLALSALNITGIKAFGPYKNIKEAEKAKNNMMNFMFDSEWYNFYLNIYKFNTGQGHEIKD